MKKLPTAVGLSAVTLSLVLGGCSTKTETKPEAASASTSAEAGASTSALPVPDLPTGPHKTIADYVTENKIIETQVKPGDPDAPKIDFAMPPDWKKAGKRKPEWAYGAIIYDKAKNPNDPPFITAIFSKLSGNVDKAKILEYSPGMLQNLPGYEQDGDVQPITVGGFDGLFFRASYLQGDVRRFIGQRTVVIPGKDGSLFVLQLNGDSLMDESQVVRDAAKVIEENSKITAPS